MTTPTPSTPKAPTPLFPPVANLLPPKVRAIIYVALAAFAAISGVLTAVGSTILPTSITHGVLIVASALGFTLAGSNVPT